MKNSLADLNEYLFGQLDRLSDDSLSGDQLQEEIERSEAITKTASMIVENAKTQIKAAEVLSDYLGGSANNAETAVLGLLTSEGRA